MAAPPTAFAPPARATTAPPANGPRSAQEAGRASFEELRATAARVSEAMNNLANADPDLEEALNFGATDAHAYQPFGADKSGYGLATSLRSADLPPAVHERYQREPQNAECYTGLVPAIGRVWASVGSALFVWRPGVAEDAPIVYEQPGGAPIVAVGWLTPRKNVFMSAVGHVAVVATPLAVSFVGVCCSGGTDTDPEQVVLQALPLYACPTNGAAVNCVACTAAGRAFFGGADGNLYEVLYGANDGDGAPSGIVALVAGALSAVRRCKVVNHTAGFLSMLPSVVPSLLPAVVAPKQPSVDQVVVDDERHYLYARDARGGLRVFDLGGDGTATRVAKKAEIKSVVATSLGAHGGGGALTARGNRGESTPEVVGMWPIPMAESRRLQLCVVLSNASRVYLSVAPDTPTAPGAQPPRPDRLVKMRERQPPNLHVATASFSATPTAAFGDATAALGGAVAGSPATGALVLAASGAGVGASCVFVEAGATPGVVLLSRSPAAASRAVSGSDYGGFGARGLREGLVALTTVGTACAVAELDRPAQAYAWLAASRRFAIVTERETRVIAETRPLGGLQSLLAPGTCPSRQAEPRRRMALEEFFNALGRPEAAALCLALAAGFGGDSSAAASAARQCLQDPELVGVPYFVDEARGGAAGGAVGLPTVATPAPGLLSMGTFDMGTAVTAPATEQVVHSAAFDGLRTLVARLLRAAWDGPVFGVASDALVLGRAFRDAREVQRLALFLDAIQRVAEESFAWSSASARAPAPAPADGSPMADGPLSLGRYGVTFGGADPNARKRRRSAEAADKEAEAGRKVLGVLRRVAELLRLVVMLQPLHPGRLALSLNPAERNRLADLTLKTFVSTDEGDSTIAKLCTAALDEAGCASADARDNLIAELRRGCPGLFRDVDQRFHEARRILQDACTLPEASVEARRSAAAEARRLLVAAAAATDPDQVNPDLEALGEVEGIAELAAACARARASTDAEGAAACRSSVAGAMERLSKSGSVAEEGETRARRLLLACAAQPDAALRSCAYAAAIKLGLDDAIIAASLAARDVQSWLESEGRLTMLKAGQGVDARAAHVLRLLSRAKAAAGQLDEAANLLLDLAERKVPSDAAVAATPVTLQDRESLLGEAALHARAGASAAVGAGAGAFASATEEAGYRCQQVAAHCEARLKLLGLQRRLVDALKTKGITSSVAELETEVVDISRLFYDVALPNKQYAECLELLSLSGHGGADETQYVQELWDRLLKAEAKAGGGGDGDETARGALAAACSAASTVGAAVLDASAVSAASAPNLGSVPLPHIVGRLEAIGAGLWPWQHAKPPAADVTSAAEAVVACAGGDAAAALDEGYDAFLRSTQAGGASADPRVRLRALRSAKELLRACASKANAAGAGYYADMASRWAAEARRLDGGDMSGDAAAVSGGLDGLASQLRASASGLGL